MNIININKIKNVGENCVLPMLRIILFSAIFASTTFAQTASVDKNKVALGEAFLLTIKTKSRPAQDPDFSSLQKDFTIIDTSRSFNTQIINGLMTQNIEYNLTLMPKVEGQITIPAITIGAAKTNPIAIKVLPQSELATTTQINIKFEGVLEKQTAYVQEEIGYSLYLTDDGGLEATEPLFSDNKDFIVKSLGQPHVSTVIKNGIKTRQVRFDYALFPQSSGNLTIPSFEIQGYVITEDDSLANMHNPFVGSFFQGMGIGLNTKRTPIALKINEKPITINPAPKDWQGWWLPAQEVALKDEFLTTDYKALEPIKRKVIIEAKGVMDTQLPEINFAEINGIKQYPSKAQSQNFVKDGEVFSIKEINHTYVPQQSGEVILPEIKINWFDVKTKNKKVTTLPQEVIYVSSPVGNGINQTPPVEETLDRQKDAIVSYPVIASETKQSNQNKIAITLSLALGIIIGFTLTRPKKANLKKAVINSKTTKELEKKLLTWGQDKFANIYNIKDVALKVNNKDFTTQTELLNQALYGNNKDFDKKEFIKIFKTIASKKKASKEAQILPTLYK